MVQTLTPEEIRVIGCLMEKSITTPDHYPMTLNALASACNQKSSRNPVMSLDQGKVEHTVRSLEEKKLLKIAENFKRGTEKYAHRFLNSPFDKYELTGPQFAVICVLLLRGAQTPGELRTRCNRLYNFDDNSEVVQTLNTMMGPDPEALIVKLPRTPGRKDSEYMHLFAGPVDFEAHVSQAQEVKSSTSSSRNNLADLTQRVSDLEQDVAELKKILQRD